MTKMVFHFNICLGTVNCETTKLYAAGHIINLTIVSQQRLHLSEKKLNKQFDDSEQSGEGDEHRIKREGKREKRERVCVCVCVCVLERESVFVIERESVCVCLREGECPCVYDRERENCGAHIFG